MKSKVKLQKCSTATTLMASPNSLPKSSSFLEIIRKILLLLWKNLILRKRHYVITTCEILLPITFSVLMSYARTQLEPHDITTFNLRSQNDLIALFANRCNDWEDCIIAYYPPKLNASIIPKLKDRLSGDFTKSIVWKSLTSHEKENLGIYAYGEKRKFLAGIIFKKEPKRFTKQIYYELRFKDYFDNTKKLLIPDSIPGPGNGTDKLYSYGGFTGLQILIDQILIQILTEGSETELKVVFNTQAFPYPKYSCMHLDQFYSVLLPQFLAQSFIFVVPAIIGTVLSEKETGVKELMKMMGLPNWMHWIGWTLNSLIVPLISATIIDVLYVISYKSNDKAVGYIEPTLWWVVLSLYIMSGTSFCFFISAFFEKPLVGTVAGLLAWVVSYYGAVIPLEEKYRDLTLVHKLLLSFFPNLGLHFALKIRSHFEATDNGAGWLEFMTPISEIDSLCFGHICLMFIVNTFFFLSFTIYLENVIPTKYGVPKPWFYIFQCKSSECEEPASENPITYSDLILNSIVNRRRVKSIGFEEENPLLKVGIELKNLCKVFGSAKIAVDNLSLKMFEGRITVIVGENGAGKTTAINLLTGLFAPTGGTAFINGHNIGTDMETIRKNLGVCPQQNMLFARLTVKEHLLFFARLKELAAEKAKLEIKELLEKLELSEKSGTLSMHLSGGQKRKLALACAIIGRSQVLVLDEPTSGMDPKARRAVWDILLELRHGRTILLTTQYMEEAEVLGDQIAVLCDGKLQCCGSPMFLKKCYGDGYKLKLTLSNKCVDVSRILSKIQEHIPPSKQVDKFIPSDSTPEVWFNLPVSWSGSTATVFPELFSSLEENKGYLGISTIGLCYVTMDEVFNRVVRLYRGNSISDEVTTLEPEKRIEARNASRMFFPRFWAIMQTRAIYLIRKRFVFICLLISPVILIGIAILIGRGVLNPGTSPGALVMTLCDYSDPITLYDGNDELGIKFNQTVGPSARNISSGNITSELLAVSNSDLLSFREQHIFAAKLIKSQQILNLTAMHSTIAPHSSPLAVNLLTNTVLRILGSETQIVTANFPIPNVTIYNAPDYPWQIPIVSSVFISISMSLMPASFVVFPAEEKLGKIKHLQMMTGVSPLCYWASLFICDFIFSLIAIGLMIAAIPVFETYGTFSQNDGLAIAFLLLSVHAVNANIFSYLVSIFVGSPPIGFAVVLTVHILSGLGFNVVIGYFRVAEYPAAFIESIRWIFRLFPSFSSTSCALVYLRIALENRRCDIYSPGNLGELCFEEDRREELTDFYYCCKNCSSINNYTCFSTQPYLAWETVDSSTNLSTPGIGQELLYMTLMAILYATLLFIIESRNLQRIFQKNSKLKWPTPAKDSDVAAEQEKIERIVLAGGCSRSSLILRQLSKKFGKVSRVSNLSLRIQPGECFGLLGLNGVGKTTTFKIIVGDCEHYSGDVFGIGNFSLAKNRSLVLPRIGYCPQMDSLIEYLTGREILHLFCRLRGVPKDSIKFEVAKWLMNTGLFESADTQCRRYSAGMRRRLCSAIAMIGDPPVVVLDEPTSCVDPIARRQLWDIMRAATKSGQAILMTSHSLEECEILCSRVGIMVSGELQCLGSVSHLKSKFSQGVSLTVKLKYLIPSDLGMQKKLDDVIRKCFRPCFLKYQNKNILQYELKGTSMPWSTIFKILEGIKLQYPNFLDEYSVQETQLERSLLAISSSHAVNSR